MHHVYSLIGCPQVPCANYILVGLDDAGQRKALHIGCVENEGQSLNLADIRQRGASLGALEVHVHLLADDADERELVALISPPPLPGASSTHSRSAGDAQPELPLLQLREQALQRAVVVAAVEGCVRRTELAAVERAAALERSKDLVDVGLVEADHRARLDQPGLDRLRNRP